MFTLTSMFADVMADVEKERAASRKPQQADEILLCKRQIRRGEVAALDAKRP